MDQQLEDLELVTFVILNLEAGEDANTMELNNNHQAELVSFRISILVLVINISVLR